MDKPTQHTERIICPSCEHEQPATVERTSPWFSYVHECERCGYIITESNWTQVGGKP